MRLKVLELILNYGTFLVKGDLNIPETREKLIILYTVLQLSGEENKAIRKDFIDYMARFLSNKRLYELNKFYVDIELKHNDQQFYRNPNIASGLLKILVERVAVKASENVLIPDLIKKLYKEVMIDALNSIYPKTGQEQINQVVNHLMFCTLGKAPIVKQHLTKVTPSDITSEAMTQAEIINLNNEKIRAEQEAQAKVLYDSIINFSDEHELLDHAEDYRDENTLNLVPEFDEELEKEFIACIADINKILIKFKANETNYIEQKTTISLNKNFFSNTWNKFKAKAFDHGKVAEHDYPLLREQIQCIPSLIDNLAEISQNQLGAYFALFKVLAQLLQQMIDKINSSTFKNELEEPMKLACETALSIIQKHEKLWRENFKAVINHGLVNIKPSDKFLEELTAKVEARQKQHAQQQATSNTNIEIENTPTPPPLPTEHKQYVRSISVKELRKSNSEKISQDTAEMFRTANVPMCYGLPDELKEAVVKGNRKSIAVRQSIDENLPEIFDSVLSSGKSASATPVEINQNNLNLPEKAKTITYPGSQDNVMKNPIL